MSEPYLFPRPRLGSETEFAALRRALEDAAFTEEAVCRRVGIERISDFKLGINPGPAPDDPLGILIWLLLHNEVISPDHAVKIPEAELRTLGLAFDHPSGKGIGCPYLLYPMRGVYLISDRTTPFDGVPAAAPDDFVYPAIVPNTGLFLDLLPWTPCDAMLDLCAGTGAAAILAAKHGARQAWSCDIADRSTDFAEFNRKLNGLHNVVASTGDLYGAVGDETFDRIVAHPPYVPVFRKQFIFDSGGKDGEHIVKGTIEGLPRHLRPGGRFFTLTMASDRREPLEQRIRQWLGPSEGEFDVAIAVRRNRDPQQYAAESVWRNKGTTQDLSEWLGEFKRLEIERFVYGWIMIQRRDRPRPVFTVRRKVGPKTGPSEHTWLTAWETSIANDGSARLLDAKPVAVREARLFTGYRLEDQGWAPETFRYEVEHPFDMELQADGWVAYLLSAADGTRTGAELLEGLKGNKVVPPDTTSGDFADMLAMLVSGGFLRV